MEFEANNKSLTIIPSSDNVLLHPYLDEDVLRHIATFLDFQSLRQFRLVSPEWNAACLPILRKRATYNLICCSYGAERPDLIKGAMDYSSWKISHSVYESAELLHDNGMWENVRSLSIHQQIPLSREFHRWACETIEIRCPDLQELTLSFQPADDCSELVDSEVESDYEQAITGHPTASFPRIADHRHLSSVRFKGIYDKKTAYFAQHLLQACTNLRHLSFCPIAGPRNVKIDVNAFRIFFYLHQNSSLLKNLQSFAFTIGRYSTEEDPSSFDKERYRFTKFIKRMTSSLGPFQFSENLRTLFWDCPFHLDGQLLPVVLTPSVTSSLIQLCLTGKVDRLGERWNIQFRERICFPNFPRLRALQLRLHTCHNLSVPELIDSAPNLSVLEMKELKGIKDSDPRHELSSIYWRANDHIISYSNPEHLQLRVFSTDIPCTNFMATGCILRKFPNLVELRLGRVQGVSLEQFLSFVQSTNPKLQRLSWISMESFTLDELFHHLIGVPEKLPALTSYSLGSNYKDCTDVTWPDSIQGMEELANVLLHLPSKSDSSTLVINLLLKSLNCHCTPEEEVTAANDCKACHLHYFIRSHDLPIRIHSVMEIEEMERKYKWNHRFDSSWIYK